MTIKAMNHVGISVADIDRSIAFYRDMLGMQVVVRTSFEGDQYATILRLKGASGRVALLRAAAMQIELFEFSCPVPRGGERDRPVCDHGITHFCIEVHDIDATYRRLRDSGVVFHCEPLDFLGGARATYGRDPDGNVFELLEVREKRSGVGVHNG